MTGENVNVEANLSTDFIKLYTTQEQSQKLIELGVPSYTADFKFAMKQSNGKVVYSLEPVTGEKCLNNDDIPCWTIGRLFQILALCYDHARCAYMIDVSDFRDLNMDDVITNDIEFNIKDGMLDFNKIKNTKN